MVDPFHHKRLHLWSALVHASGSPCRSEPGERSAKWASLRAKCLGRQRGSEVSCPSGTYSRKACSWLQSYSMFVTTDWRDAQQSRSGYIKRPRPPHSQAVGLGSRDSLKAPQRTQKPCVARPSARLPLTSRPRSSALHLRQKLGTLHRSKHVTAKKMASGRSEKLNICISNGEACLASPVEENRLNWVFRNGLCTPSSIKCRLSESSCEQGGGLAGGPAPSSSGKHQKRAQRDKSGEAPVLQVGEASFSQADEKRFRSCGAFTFWGHSNR